MESTNNEASEKTVTDVKTKTPPAIAKPFSAFAMPSAIVKPKSKKESKMVTNQDGSSKTVNEENGDTETSKEETKGTDKGTSDEIKTNEVKKDETKEKVCGLDKILSLRDAFFHSFKKLFTHNIGLMMMNF